MRLLAPLLIGLALASPAGSQGLGIAATDTLHTVIAAQQGKRVTVRLRSGQELTGLVRQSSDRLLVLGEVSGREFFDAVLPMEAIEAVLVRVRQQ